MNRSCLLLFCAIAFLTPLKGQDDPKPLRATPVTGEDSKGGENGETPVRNTGDVRKVAFPSPYGRLLGLEAHLRREGIDIDWEAQYEKTAFKDLDIEKLKKDEGTLCMAIGIRLADGVVAFLGRDQEKLKKCADDVRICAEHLGATRDDLPAITHLLRSIQSEDWPMVFFELGMIQQEVVAKVDDGADSTATLVTASGAWLHGIVYATDIILEYQDEIDLSNMLRAPQIADFLGARLSDLPPETRDLPQIAISIEVLSQVRPMIDIARDEVIEAEKLKKLRETAAAAVSPVINQTKEN